MTDDKRHQQQAYDVLLDIMTKSQDDKARAISAWAVIQEVRARQAELEYEAQRNLIRQEFQPITSFS